MNEPLTLVKTRDLLEAMRAEGLTHSRSLGTVRRWAQAGCPHERCGTRLVFDPQAVAAWLRREEERKHRLLPAQILEVERGHPAGPWAFVERRPGSWADRRCRYCDPRERVYVGDPPPSPRRRRLGVAFHRARREHTRQRECVRLCCGVCGWKIKLLSLHRVPKVDLDQLPLLYV